MPDIEKIIIDYHSICSEIDPRWFILLRDRGIAVCTEYIETSGGLRLNSKIFNKILKSVNYDLYIATNHPDGVFHYAEYYSDELLNDLCRIYLYSTMSTTEISQLLKDIGESSWSTPYINAVRVLQIREDWKNHYK